MNENCPSTTTRGEEDVFDLEARPRAVLVYEDLSTGLRAKQDFDQLVDRFDTNSGTDLKMWKIDLLRDERVREQAAHDAADFGIIFVSPNGQSELSEEFREWLNRVLDLRGDRSTAIVVLLNPTARNSMGASRILEDIWEKCGQANAEVFPHLGEKLALESGLKVEEIRNRVDSSSSVLEGILHQTDSYRRFSVNY